MITDVVGYTGEIRFQPDMPDGMPRKLLDVSQLNAMGWSPSIDQREGVESTYQWYRRMTVRPQRNKHDTHQTCLFND